MARFKKIKKKLKKAFLFISMCLLMVSCKITDEEYQQKVEEYAKLTSECKSLSSQERRLYSNISQLQSEVKKLQVEKNAFETGKTLKYIVKFEIKQGTFTLDPWEHIKNSMNAIEVEIPVDKDYYNALKIDQDLTDAFKWGSLVMDGDFSNLHMRVVSKRIE